jgi:hypothetical protein
MRRINPIEANLILALLFVQHCGCVAVLHTHLAGDGLRLSSGRQAQREKNQ